MQPKVPEIFKIMVVSYSEFPVLQKSHSTQRLECGLNGREQILTKENNIKDWPYDSATSVISML